MEFFFLSFNQVSRGKNTVTYEARYLKALLLQLEME